MYSYNSYHKIITVAIFIGWAIFHFTQRENDGLYYKNGQIKIEGSRVNAINEGKWVWYYENGVVQMSGNFKNGKREGTWNRFDKNGRLVAQSNYRNNVLDGVFLTFNKNGDTLSVQYYEQDKLVSNK